MTREERDAKKKMERVLLAYGRRINEGKAWDKRPDKHPRTIPQVMRYCAALKRVWDLAASMDEARSRRKRR